MYARMLSRVAVSAAVVWFTWAVAGCQDAGSQRRDGATPAGSAESEKVVPPTQGPMPAPEAGEVDEDQLVLLAEAEPDAGEAPLKTRFSVESLMYDEMNEPKYTWDFGDGTPPSHDASPEHVYAKQGSYVATIRIVDGEGLRGWDEIDIEVDPSEQTAGES